MTTHRTDVRAAGKGGLPSYRDRAPLPLRELPVPALLGVMINASNSYVRTYTLGECTVIVTREYGRWHLSISHRGRYPTWDEIAEARYRLLPSAICAALILPPPERYINLNPNCFQVQEIDWPLKGEGGDA